MVRGSQGVNQLNPTEMGIAVRFCEEIVIACVDTWKDCFISQCRLSLKRCQTSAQADLHALTIGQIPEP